MEQQAYYAMSESVEWYTPAYILEAVGRVLGGIDCDPCSNPEPYNVPAITHYTRVDDGLAQQWPGTVFMNPPFGTRVRGEGIEAWLRKLIREYRAGRCSAAIALTPSRTEAAWFQHLWMADAICFVRGRVQFLGSKQSGNTTGTVLAYWGPEANFFATEFRALGHVICGSGSLWPHTLLTQAELFTERPA